MDLALMIVNIGLCVGVIVTGFLSFTAPASAVVKRSVCIFCNSACLTVFFAMRSVEAAHEGRTSFFVISLFACLVGLTGLIVAYATGVKGKSASATQKPANQSTVPLS